MNQWTMSRTDIQSYDGNGDPVCFLYPPDESQERIAIRGLDCRETARRLLVALNVSTALAGAPSAGPSQKEIGLIYNLGAAMVQIGRLQRFVNLALEKCADKFHACIYCARHLPTLSHSEDCPLIQAIKDSEFKATEPAPSAGRPEANHG